MPGVTKGWRGKAWGAESVPTHYLGWSETTGCFNPFWAGIYVFPLKKYSTETSHFLWNSRNLYLFKVFWPHSAAISINKNPKLWIFCVTEITGDKKIAEAVLTWPQTFSRPHVEKLLPPRDRRGSEIITRMPGWHTEPCGISSPLFLKVNVATVWGFCLENIIKKVQAYKYVYQIYHLSYHVRNQNHNSIMKTRMKWAPKRVQGFESHTYLSPYLHLRTNPGLPNATRVPTDPWRPGRRSSNESVSWRRFQVGRQRGIKGRLGGFLWFPSTMYPWHLDGVLGWDSWGILGKGYIQLSPEGK